jgi:hypothetical protein
MTGFKEALLEQLTAELTDADRPVPAIPATQRGPIRRSAAFAAGVAAVAILGAILLSPQQAKPAYAITTEDGVVTLKINFIGEPADANRKLQKAGVRAVIVLEKPDCTAKGGDAVRGAVEKQLDLAMRFTTASQNDTLRIRPADIPEDQILVVVPIKRHQSASTSAGAERSAPLYPVLSATLHHPPAPSCVVPREAEPPRPPR